MKNILVTGGAGFIGSHIVNHHIEKGDHVWAVDNLISGRTSNIKQFQNHPSFKFDQADVCNWPKMQEAVNWADGIYHMAAIVGQYHVLAKPIETLFNNVRSCESILEAMSKTQKKGRLLIASTSSVYIHSDTDVNGTSLENSKICFPSGIFIQEAYPLSKFTTEVMGLSALFENDVDCTIARIFNTIGVNQHSHYGMVVPSFIEQALKGLPITIYGTGKQTRCFMNVHDTVEVFNLLLENPKSKGEIYNVGNDLECSIIDLAKLVREITQSKSEIVYIPYKEAYGIDFFDVQRRVPNLEKLKNLIEFRPKWTLEQTIQEIMESYKRCTSTL